VARLSTSGGHFGGWVPGKEEGYRHRGGIAPADVSENDRKTWEPMVFGAVSWRSESGRREGGREKDGVGPPDYRKPCRPGKLNVSEVGDLEIEETTAESGIVTWRRGHLCRGGTA